MVVAMQNLAGPHELYGNGGAHFRTHSDAHLANIKEFLLLVEVVHRNFGAACTELFFSSNMLWKPAANFSKGLCRARPASAAPVPEWLWGWFGQMEGFLFVLLFFNGAVYSYKECIPSRVFI